MLQASDFSAVYDKLLAEFQVATTLSGEARLGRTVPSLAPAECVIGLMEGVKEHDHERLRDALKNADKLGLASRLAAPMNAAQEEIGHLELGMVIEEKLIAELATSRSKYQGGCKWDHKPISTSRLEAAVKDGEVSSLLGRLALNLTQSR